MFGSSRSAFSQSDLLREMHHAVLPLVVSYKRVFPEHIQRQGGIAAQRVFFPQENIGGELSQLIKAQIAGIKELLHGIEIMLVDTQDAELTAPGRHIVYDLMGRALADGNVIMPELKIDPVQ